MTETADVLAAVRERVDPTPAERERLAETAARLVERAEDAIAELSVDADVVRVGSTARGTWVRGDRDIDVFVRFPPALERAELERYGLHVGNDVLPEGHEEYAEHPYVKGEFEGYDVDLVPCYDVDSARDIRSAVDRTPFHTEYLEARLTDALAADVRVFKQFLKGIGAYGSDLKTRGFSGYLSELLVVEYGGFEAVMEAAADAWQPPVRLDPEDHAAASFDDPLVVIDPTDPERNVAAVVSAANVARLQHYARRFREDPREAYFFPEPRDPLDAAAVRERLAERGTHALAVRFDDDALLGLVEDQRYPQLRRSLDGLVRGLENHGFEVLRGDAWSAETAVLVCELSVAELPDVERHRGPPVHVGEHAAGFYGKYADDPDVAGPYIDGGRYVVERERDVTTAREFAERKLASVALGKRLASLVADGDYEVYAGAEVGALAAEFGVEFADYFDPRP
ncbi:CCA tRNA nucleotidyltransferase [Halarchaeum sp. CBA1220]|uniref:CCA tRNA nucleotidyltransferase n=1 Tax=Halarchaeum sp. CBA1220 TaxID=1853682 RepID=UPI000F3A868C|nr:CCA tRNA nucleotidyltransferase [Halarchaeum sp. CBA1220]QLC33632.1 CCA tRNA nucleotidyltransferase [Halarchaeum sp. CBA1220]